MYFPWDVLIGLKKSSPVVVNQSGFAETSSNKTKSKIWETIKKKQVYLTKPARLVFPVKVVYQVFRDASEIQFFPYVTLVYDGRSENAAKISSWFMLISLSGE